MQELTKVHTPDMHTIEEICEFLHVDANEIHVKPLFTREIPMTHICLHLSCVAISKLMRQS